jgi:hypothetical protein
MDETMAWKEIAAVAAAGRSVTRGPLTGLTRARVEIVKRQAGERSGRAPYDPGPARARAPRGALRPAAITSAIGLTPRRLYLY